MTPQQRFDFLIAKKYTRNLEVSKLRNMAKANKTTKVTYIREFLKKSRETTRVSQVSISDKLGYTTPQFVSNWERWVSAPPLKTLKRLADSYGVSQDKLFDLFLKTRTEEIKLDFKKSFYGS